VVPNRADLTANERKALTMVQASGGLTATEWMEATDLAKGSFHNARRRLVSLAYVRHSRRKYIATSAGRLAQATKLNSGATQVQTAESTKEQHALTPLGVSVVPDQPKARGAA